jgi:hypothetical protein
MIRQIICKQCSASVTLTGAEDPHAALQCGCCPEEHHHGQATTATGIPCRPVTHVIVSIGEPLRLTTG